MYCMRLVITLRAHADTRRCIHISRSTHALLSLPRCHAATATHKQKQPKKADTKKHTHYKHTYTAAILFFIFNCNLCEYIPLYLLILKHPPSCRAFLPALLVPSRNVLHLFKRASNTNNLNWTRNMVVTYKILKNISHAGIEGVKEDKKGVCITSILIPRSLAVHRLYFFQS